MEEKDRIGELFNDKTIFISGGTGFLGKVLIEKLLRLGNVRRIYILIRRKKGMSVNERLASMFKNPLFDTVRAQDPEKFNRCTGTSGEVTVENLGLSEFFRNKIINEADYIFHFAATTRFDETFKFAVIVNTRGTKYMLDLAEECKHLKLFVHCSTAYAFPNEDIVKEIAYKPPADPHVVLDSLTWIKDDDSGKLTKELLGDSPNTYTFSKAVAEQLVNEKVGKLPVIIVRPGLVIPIYDSPLPGWCNNLQGPMGLFVGAGKGVIRSMYMKGDAYANLIPADITINVMLAAVRQYMVYDKKKYVYNAIVPQDDVRKTWDEIIETGKKIIGEDVPFNTILWYPGGGMTQNKLKHTIYFYLFQMLPAIFVDILLFALGYKPCLYQIQRRIQKSGVMFEFYVNRTWHFEDPVKIIVPMLNSVEKELYKLDSEGLDVRKYLIDCMLCVRRVNLKETDDMLPRAKLVMKIMFVVDKFCKIAIMTAFFYYIYKLICLPLLK